MTDLQYTDYINVINNFPVPQEDLKHFKSIEWTRKYVEDPLYRAVAAPSRIFKSSGEDEFFANTVKSPSTIAHWLSFILKDYKTPTETSNNLSLSHGVRKLPFPTPEKPECFTLLQLEPGLNGFKDTMHGGVLSAILDEALGICLEVHRQLLSDAREYLYTATLNITYRGPIPTPSAVILKCWLEGRQGRKWIMRGQIIGEDGQVYTEAEGLWIQAKKANL